MTFEEFEKADKKVLRKMAKECFERSRDAEGHSHGNTSLLLDEAQFYLSQIERRSSSRIAWRDLILEVVVILLIGGEIRLALKQGRDEDDLMGKQNGILTNLQTSTSNTADAIANLTKFTKTMSETSQVSANTLLALKLTTETMNKAVHDQVDLFYDPALYLSYNSDPSRLLLTNTGKSGLTLTSLEVNNQPANIGSKLISVGTNFYIEYPQMYKNVAATLSKGSSLAMPVKATLKNEIGRTFVFTGTLLFIWDNDKLVVHSQQLAVVPTQ